MLMLPSSSSDPAALDDPRFHLKLRNGLFDRSCDLRPIFNEPPLVGVRGDDVDDIGVENLGSIPRSGIIFTCKLGLLIFQGNGFCFSGFFFVS